MGPDIYAILSEYELRALEFCDYDFPLVPVLILRKQHHYNEKRKQGTNIVATRDQRRPFVRKQYKQKHAVYPLKRITNYPD